MRPVNLAALIGAALFVWMLTFGDTSVSPVFVDDPQRQITADTEIQANPIRAKDLLDGELLDPLVPALAGKAVAASSTAVTSSNEQITNRAVINVGDYIDPDELPPSVGEQINIGSYIDPEELPEYSGREVNAGSFIDPEELPEGSGVRINYGVYMDPEAPRVAPSEGANVGPALLGPIP